MSDTKATMRAVLERLNELGEQLRSEIQSVHKEVVEFRAETREALHVMERRLDVMTIDVSKLRADMRRLDEHMDRLEKTPA